jgi:hypothetical protein
MNLLNEQVLFFTGHIQVNSESFLVGKVRFIVITEPFTFIFEFFLVPFADVKVEGY